MIDKDFHAEAAQHADTENTTTNNTLNENTDTQEVSTDPQVETSTVETKLIAAESEIVELKDKLLRQAADFANFRKHSISTQTELILNGGKKVIESLLPILDDLERAEMNLNTATDVDTLREGLLLIFQKMNRTLEQQGLIKMETSMADFNTDFHEAVALFPVEEEDKKNKIIDCVQTGYLLNDKVLRHAKVVVGQ